VELVDSWLTHHDIDLSSAHRSGGNDSISLRVSVAQAERLLDTKYNVYRHSKTSEYVVRSLRYSLPNILHSHVDLVTPTTYFGTMRSMKATSFLQPNIKAIESSIQVDDTVDAASCAVRVTPSCLRALYNTASYTPQAAGKNSLGIAGYLNQYANYADLQTFFKMFRPDAVGGNFTTVAVNNGGDDQSDPGSEANLDIQYTEGISYPTPNTYYRYISFPKKSGLFKVNEVSPNFQHWRLSPIQAGLKYPQ
jgi:tripeptidyl-peptidase-1